MSTKEVEIRKRLELVYAPLLSERDITITVRNKQLRPQMHCTWSESRYVRYNNQNVPARINIDRVLGSALFDVTRNRYLIPDEAEEYYEAQQEERLYRQISLNVKSVSQDGLGYNGTQILMTLE